MSWTWVARTILLAAGLLGETSAQQLQGSQRYIDYPGLSPACHDALNTTVSCAPLLGLISLNLETLDVNGVEQLCKDDCRQSLNATKTTIAQACSAESDIISFGDLEYPATFIIESFVLAYDLSCRKDRTTGEFCDPQLRAWSNQSDLDPSQTCSDCWLGAQSIQLSSPLGYDEDAASSFANLTSSCNATGYDFSIPTPYSQNAPETVQAASADIATPAKCPDSYTIKPGDDCHSVARQLNVSSYSLLQQNYLDLYCRSFATAGTAICIPPQCDTYTWLPTDTCERVVSQHTSLSVPQFLAWNPNFNSLCGNSFNFIGYSVCISPPGGFRTYSYPTTPTPTNTTQPGYASTAATVPPNARDNSTRNCGSWHTIVKGDTCATLSLFNSISLSDLQFLNPTLDQNCTTLVLDLAYCVRPVGDIATYPTYTQSDVLDIHVPAACFPPYDPAATALIVNERGAGMNTTASGTGPGPSLTALPLVAEKSAHAKRHFDRRGVDAMDSVVAHAHGIGFGRSVTA